MIYTDRMATFTYKAPKARKHSYTKKSPSGKAVRVYRAENIRFVGENSNGSVVDMRKLNTAKFMRGGASAPRLLREHSADIGTIEKMSFEPIGRIGGRFDFEFSFTDRKAEQEWIDGRVSGFSFQLFAENRKFRNGTMLLFGDAELGEITLTNTPAYENAYYKRYKQAKANKQVDAFLKALAVEN